MSVTVCAVNSNEFGYFPCVQADDIIDEIIYRKCVQIVIKINVKLNKSHATMKTKL